MTPLRISRLPGMGSGAPPIQMRLRFRTAVRSSSRAGGGGASAAAPPDWPGLPGGGCADSERDEPHAPPAPPSVRSAAELETLAEAARARFDVLCDELAEAYCREAYAPSRKAMDGWSDAQRAPGWATMRDPVRATARDRHRLGHRRRSRGRRCATAARPLLNST